MSEPYVVAKGLGKSFGKKKVLRDFSLTVRPGEVVGVLGKNGAGKTTLLELMLGFTLPSAGSIEVFGEHSGHLSGAAKSRIGFVPQIDELIGHFRARDQIKVIRSFYEHWDDQLIDRLAQTWQLDVGERIGAMSTGQRQKLSILLALGHRPDLLMLDEPVASLDPIARRRFLEQIVEVAADGRRAVVFSSHIVSDIERLATKIWILKDGTLHWHGDFDTLKESVVRLHIRSASALASGLEVPNAISVQRSERHLSAIVTDWNDELTGSVISRYGADVELETLNLEDIFLELHR